MKKILILQGHPDCNAEHYCDAIAKKYTSATESAGNQVRTICIAELDFPLLSSLHDFDYGEPCADIVDAQNDIMWADHVVIIYPLWLGDMPAIVKGFWEQVLRPDFAIREISPNRPFEKLLKGKSARVIVTMGMPASVYRWFFKAHSVKSLKRNILSFCGFKPVDFTLIGGAREGNSEHLTQELSKISRLGREGQ